MKRFSKKIASATLATAMVATQLICSTAVTYAAEITPSSAQGQRVYFQLPSEWTGRVDANTGKSILPGVYVTGGTHGEPTPWVGEHMQLVEGTEDIYSYVIPEDQTEIIFNTGQQRDWQTGNVAICGGDMLYVVDSGKDTKNAQGHWEPYNTTSPKGAVSDGDFKFVGKRDVKLSAFNYTSATYSIDGGAEVPYENGDTITIGENTANDTDILLTLKVSNDTEEHSFTYKYHKLISLRVYAQNKAGWEHMFAHCWGGESNLVWPGVEMTLVDGSEDVYFADLPSKTTNYKFNNGDAVYGDATHEEQTSNLATQSIVAGITDCYVINALAPGESANTGEYTSLEKALNGSIEEGKPVISVENTMADLGSVFDVNVKLGNVEKLNAYLISLSYDSSLVEPVLENLPENVTANVVSNGTLYIAYSTAQARDFTEEGTLVTIQFKAVADKPAQAKIKVTPMQVYSGLETKISFPSSNVVTGKVMLGVDRTQLKALIDTASALDENKYTTLTYQAVEAALQTALDALVENSDDGNYYYFKNTVGWKEVYAYWWGSEVTCPSFPGVKVSLVNGSADVYYVDLPIDATGLNFNDGSNEDGNKFQTNSITGDSLGVTGNMFVPDPSNTTEKNNGIRYGGTVETYTQRKIYFANTADWEDVYCYWWGGSSDITACPGFPGIPATLMPGTKNVYYVVIPDDATGFNFSNGKAGTDGGEQTNSMSAFEPNKLLKLDLDSKYVKNGGYRYAASYVDLKAFVNGQKYGTGDVNGDGTIDINDVTMLQNGLAGSEELSQTQLYSADANYDGKVSIDDATKISLYIAQSISAF